MIVFAAGGFTLALYGTRPMRGSGVSHGHIMHFAVPQPLHFVLTWVIVTTVVFAIWGRVVAALLSSADRGALLRRYWLGWFPGSLGFLSGSAGTGTVMTGLASGISYATVGIAATWLYYRYTARAHSGRDGEMVRSGGLGR